MKDSAAQSAYNLDTGQAGKTLSGLMHYPAVKQAEIRDEVESILASKSKVVDVFSYQFLVDLTFGREHEFRYPLSVNTRNGNMHVGSLIVLIDSYPIVSDFISRSLVTFVAGMVRNICFGFLLVVLYNYMLVRPLKKVVRGLGKLDPDDAEQKIVDCFISKDQYTDTSTEMQALMGGVQRLFESAQQSISRVKEDDELKQEILNVLSHELRTPMNSVLGNLDLLKQKVDRAEYSYVEDAYESANLLVEKLSDMLLFSEINSCCFQLHLEKLPISKLLDRIKNDYPEVDLRCEPSVSESEFKYDISLTYQVLRQLLDNQVKFCDIDASYCEFGVNSASRLFVRLVDSGPGFPADKVKYISETFRQGEQGFSRRFDGLGIGLSIAMGGVRLLGAQMKIENVSDGGTCIDIQFPFEMIVVSAGSGLDKLPHVPERVFEVHPRRVLLVEDNKINQAIESKMLSKIGCSVEVAGNGREAIEKIVEQDFDVVLMDCQMPVMDGFEATRAIRKLGGRVSKIPIIAVTANALSGDKYACLEAGMDDYIAKPVSTDELKEKLACWS
ncbi:MAG: hypothetical protein COA99_15415 [Moraxellaceae bacterium]|nr:MAG: hypothetical protein COA99_15415 [Moraxellaceae bacterium]